MEKEQSNVIAPFTFRSQRAMMTYKTHLNKVEFKNWVHEHFPRAIFCELAHEKESSETNYEHTHVLIDFGYQLQSSSCGFMDYEGIHPNIENVPAKYWGQKLKYISKEDKECNFSIASKIASIQNCDTLTDALSTAESMSQMHPIKIIYEARAPKKVKLSELTLANLRGWQRLAYDCFLGSDQRLIYWYYDPIGNTGKTELCKFLEQEVEGTVVMYNINGVSNTAHLMTPYHGKEIRICYDLARQEKDYQGLYHSLEVVRNGAMTSTKYQGGQVRFKCLRLFVFANFEPDQDKMSVDRWVVTRI